MQPEDRQEELKGEDVWVHTEISTNNLNSSFQLQNRPF